MKPPARLLAIFVALTLGLSIAGGAGANPFAGKSAEPPRQEAAEAERAWGPLAWVGRTLLTIQREASRMIATHMKAIRDGGTSTPLLIGVALAFAYGVVHALGPGHGKLVVVSYFLAREARIGRGLFMGLQIAVFHVLSAMVVVALADFLLRQAFGGAPAEVAGVRLLSYGLIALIGATMLVQAVRRSRARRAGHDLAHACCHHGEGARQQGFLSLGVGIVPCTGAVLILLYALANDILVAGMILVSAIAAGMAITMGALGVLSVVARQAVARRIETGGGNGRLAAITDYAGALAILMVGTGLFWATL